MTSIAVNIGVEANAGTVTGAEFGHIQAHQFIINITNVTSGSPAWHIATSRLHLSDIGYQNLVSLISELKDAETKIAGLTNAPVGPQLFLDLLAGYFRLQEDPIAQEPQPHHLKCFDQEETREKIRYPDQSVRVVEICGLGGLGKSHILNAVQNAEQSTSGLPSEERAAWQQWKRLYVDAQHRPLCREEIIQAFAKQLDGSAATSEDLAPFLVSALHTSSYTGVLFMIDNADAVPTEVLAEFADDGDGGLVGRKMRMRLEHTRIAVLRLVIASRSPRLTEQGRKDHEIHGVLHRFLDALDVEHVRGMLEERVGDPVPRPSSTWFNDRARHIFEVSGGHPRSVAYVLSVLAHHHFTTLPEDYRDRFTPIVLRIVRRDIIGNLTLSDYGVLNILSVFRWFTVHELVELCKYGLLPEPVLATNAGSTQRGALRDWLKDFCENTALIRKLSDEYQLRYTVHPVLRHVLPMDLYQYAPNHLCQLHKSAYALYDKLLTERDRSNVRLMMSPLKRPMYVLEALYHAVYEHRLCGDTLGDLVARMKIYVDLHREAVSGLSDTDADLQPYAERWHNDTELHEHIKDLRGGSQAHAQLNDFFSALA
jgi:hypothetical protein